MMLHSVSYLCLLPESGKEYSLFSTPYPSVTVCRVADNGCSECYEAIPSRGCDLRFSYLVTLTSFHVLSFQG